MSTGTTTDYASNFVYENNTLQFFNQPEGYVEPNGSGWKYVYQYKDHLGNIRLSYKDISTTSTPSLQIQEENNYYPFGLKHKGYNNVQTGRDHKFGFGNKEEQDELGLGWIDIMARNYDPALGRWMNIDPLAEKRNWITPYNYVQNNPILRIDPTGLLDDTFGVNDKGEIRKIDEKKYYDEKGNEVDKLIADKTGNSTMVEDGVLDEQNVKTRIITGVVTKTKEGKDITVNTKTTEFSVKGNEKGKSLFNFLADNTSVEWSLMRFDGELANYIQTGRLERVEPAASTMLSTDFRVKPLNYHQHSHPGSMQVGTSPADRTFAKQVKYYFGEHVIFGIRATGSKTYREYDENGLTLKWLFDE